MPAVLTVGSYEDVNDEQLRIISRTEIIGTPHDDVCASREKIHAIFYGFIISSESEDRGIEIFANGGT